MASPIVVTLKSTGADRVVADAKKVGGAYSSLGGKVKRGASIAAKAAAGLALVGAAAAVKLGSAFVKSASDAEQSLGATKTVFGKFADDVIRVSQKAADRYGLSANSYRENANLIGSLFANQGVATDQLNKKTEEQIARAADLAATYGGTTKDAVEALGSAFKGEFDPLEKYGISLKASTVSAEAAAIAQREYGKDLEKLTVKQQAAVKQQATSNIITKQSAKATGAFARESDTLAHKQQVLSAKIENVKAKIGNVLLPIISTIVGYLIDKGIPKFKEFGTKAANLAKLGWEKLKTGRDFIKKIAEFAGDAAEDVRRLVSRIKQVDFSDLDAGEVGQLIGEAIVDGIATIGSLAGKITAAVGKLMGKVDWVGIGIDIGKQAPALLAGLALGILNFDIGSLLSGLGAHWQEVLIGILTIAFLPARIAGALGKILTKIPFVGKFLAQAVKWINDAGGKLAKFGGDLFKSLWRGLTNGKALPGVGIVKRILGGLASIPGRVKSFIDDLGVRLGVWALNAFEAIGRGARIAVVGLLKFVISIPGRILSGIGNLARLLAPKGVAAIESMVQGFRDRIGVLLGFVRGIPGRILSGIGNLGSLLLGAGQAIIQGLIDGLVSKFGDVKSTLSGLTKSITNWKGPESLDKILLKPAGSAIIKGLIAGFIAATPDVRSALSKLTDQIRDHFDKVVKNDKAARLASKAALAGLSDEYAALTKNAKARDKLNEKLKRAKEALRDLKAQAADYAASVRDAILATGDLTSLGGRTDEEGNDIPVTAASILEDLAAKVAAAQRFAALIAQLTASGLNSTSLQQLIDAGAEGGLATAEALAAGGQAAVDQANALTAELNRIGVALGTSTSATMYAAGVQTAQGLVEGLAADAEKLEKQATKLARALVRAVKKALGINSPSRVFQGLGGNVVQGLALGLDETYVRRQGQFLAKSLQTGFGTPALDALAAGVSVSGTQEFRITLSAEQLTALQRGRQIEADRREFIRNGGRPAS